MNLREIDDNFSIAEQIHKHDLMLLKEAGYTDVVCNRPDNEDPGQPSFSELEAEAIKIGMKTHHLAFDGRNYSPDHVVGLREVLDGAEGRTVAFCRTGNRSLLLWSRVDADA
jgi:sulfide:quinone oxidoreductase